MIRVGLEVKNKLSEVACISGNRRGRGDVILADDSGVVVSASSTSCWAKVLSVSGGGQIMTSPLLKWGRSNLV